MILWMKGKPQSLKHKVVSPLSSRLRDRFGGDKDEDKMTSRVVKGA